MTDNQTLKITYTCGEFKITAEYSQNDLGNNDMFWEWFMNVCPSLGLGFISGGIEKL